MNLAEIGLLSYGMNAVWLLIALAVLVILLRTYAQTRMSGFLWLLFATVVWPFFARGASLLMPMLLARESYTGDAMVVRTIGLAAVETIVGAVLLLISAIVLQRQLASQMLLGRPGVPMPPASGLPPYNG